MGRKTKNGQARSEVVTSRVTPDEKAKIQQLSAIRRISESELLRDHSIRDLVEEMERIEEMVGSRQPA